MQARHEKLLGILLWRGQGTWYAAVYVYDMYIPLVVVLSEVSEAATELGAKQKRRFVNFSQPSHHHRFTKDSFAVFCCTSKFDSCPQSTNHFSLLKATRDSPFPQHTYSLIEMVGVTSAAQILCNDNGQYTSHLCAPVLIIPTWMFICGDVVAMLLCEV